MSYLENGSFKFGDIDMFDTYGIQILDSSMAEDLLLPAIRPRKVTVPFRHGAYDYGAKYYDERTLTLNCVTLMQHSETEARAFLREIAYVLSKKDKIRLWNEPDKYYVGQIENEISFTQHRDVANAFDIEFTCEPFAYGKTVTIPVVNNTCSVNYVGTVKTPSRIIITNTGGMTITDIVISQLRKLE